MKELLNYMARHHEDLEKSFTDNQKDEYSAPVEHPGRLRLNTRTCGQLFGPKHISRFLGAEANQAPPKAACS